MRNLTFLFPPLFPLNLSLVLRLSVSYLISPNATIVFDKVVISSIPPNPPYYITIILIVSSDKDISPNTIIALDKSIPPNTIIVLDKELIISPDKDFALILIIVLDRATLQPLL
jgi:hypothetical protein